MGLLGPLARSSRYAADNVAISHKRRNCDATMMSFSDFSWHKMRRPTSRQIDIDAYWSVPTHKLLATLGTAAQGLTLRKARLRLKRHGPNLLEAKKKNKTTVDLVVSQFKTPLVLILIISVDHVARCRRVD